MQIKSVDKYITEQPEPFQETLQRLRTIIRSEVPDVRELIRYQIPCFKHHYMLVGIGVTQDACSFYTMNPVLVDRMRAELADIQHAGATLHFPPGEPLPEPLLRKMIQARVAENEERAALKGQG